MAAVGGRPVLAGRRRVGAARVVRQTQVAQGDAEGVAKSRRRRAPG